MKQTIAPNGTKSLTQPRLWRRPIRTAGNYSSSVSHGAPDPVHADTRRPRGLVLVVEDEPAIADVIRLNLAKAGYGVHVEHRGDTALKTIERLRPAAIILDVTLPG